MDGDPTDNNATLFAQGYNGVLKPHFDNGAYVKVGEPAGTWTPSVAQTTFAQQYTAHPNINAVVTPNDDNANAVIAYLQSKQIKPKTFPTTGQDASLPGLQNILKGYQCGTVYKPIYLEAQAAAAVALYLRAGQTPPSALVNGTTQDSQANAAVPSVAADPDLGHQPRTWRPPWSRTVPSRPPTSASPPSQRPAPQPASADATRLNSQAGRRSRPASAKAAPGRPAPIAPGLEGDGPNREHRRRASGHRPAGTAPSASAAPAARGVTRTSARSRRSPTSTSTSPPAR